MRRALIALLFVPGCGSLRTAEFADDEGCAESDCETGQTTSSDEDTSTSMSTTGDGEDESDDDGTAGFFPTDDMDSVEICDIFDPDSCPEGEKCTSYATMGTSWDANKCVPVMGDQGWLEPCQAFGENPGLSGLDDCAKGYMCWDVDENDMGHCLAFCIGSANEPACPGDDGICVIYSGAVIPLCLATCDPLAQGADCPDPDDLCVAEGGGRGFVCVLDASGGLGTYGAECSFVNACNQGLFCAAADAVPGCQGSQGCCSEFCDIDEPNTCAGKDGGQECVPWWEMGMAPPGYQHVGGCAIPE